LTKQIGITFIDIPIGHDHRPVKFSRDNTKILIGTKIYNCLDGSPLSTVSEIRGGATTDSIISGDLQKYLVLNLYGMKELLSTPLTLNFGVPFAYCDLKSGTEIHKFRLKPSFPFRFIVDSSQDGSKVLITDWLDSDGLSSRIAFLDTLSSDIVNINYSGPTGLRAKNPLIQARFSNDEESVFLSSIDSVSIFSVQSKELVFSDSNSYGITANSDNSVMVMLNKDNTIQVYAAKEMRNICELKSRLLVRKSREDKRFLEEIATSRVPTRIDIGSDGTVLAVSGAGEIELWVIS